MQVNIGSARINNSECEKLLGTKIDCKLSFEDHIRNICKKAGAKLNALSTVAQSLNHKINRLHERCLRVIYNDSHSSYDELLNLDNSVSIQQEFTDFNNRNVQGIHWVSYLYSK